MARSQIFFALGIKLILRGGCLILYGRLPFLFYSYFFFFSKFLFLVVHVISFGDIL